MKLHGTILESLQAAAASAKRLRGKPVHVDTMDFWRRLLAEGERRWESLSPPEQARLATFAGMLEHELEDRRR